MTLETETVLDRRRLRRSVMLWRGGTIAALALAAVAYLAPGDMMKTGFGQHQIARVTFEGTIAESRSQLKMLKEIEESKTVDGVIVYVNSPGGTTSGGEAIYEAIRKIGTKKPVVAQFGTLAASAGYIIGLSADHIVSRGNTITGSIGVIAQWPEVSQLLDKVGVRVNEVKSGPLKAAPSMFEPMNDASRSVMEKMIGDGFQWFLGIVEERRGIKPADIDGLVKGRVFTGREALAVKLVDEIGGEAEAIKWLEEKRGLSKDLKVIDWKPKKASDWSLSASAGEAAGSFAAELAGGIIKSLTSSPLSSSVALDGLLSVWQPSEK